MEFAESTKQINLELILPSLIKTFKKRKKIEEVKKEITFLEEKLKKAQTTFEMIKNLPKIMEELEAEIENTKVKLGKFEEILLFKIDEIRNQIVKKNKEKIRLEREVITEESKYSNIVNSIIGIKLKSNEVLYFELEILIYLMWLSDMDSSLLFDNPDAVIELFIVSHIRDERKREIIRRKLEKGNISCYNMTFEEVFNNA